MLIETLGAAKFVTNDFGIVMFPAPLITVCATTISDTVFVALELSVETVALTESQLVMSPCAFRVALDPSVPVIDIEIELGIGVEVGEALVVGVGVLVEGGEVCVGPVVGLSVGDVVGLEVGPLVGVGETELVGVGVGEFVGVGVGVGELVGDEVGAITKDAEIVPFPLIVATVDAELALLNRTALTGEAVQEENKYPFAGEANIDTFCPVL